MSSTFRFYPYPVVIGRRALEFVVERQDTDEAVGDGPLDLSGYDAPTVPLRIRLSVPSTTLESVLPQEQRTAPPVKALVLVESDASRIREAVALSAAGSPLEFHGEWVASGQFGYGDVALTPVLTRLTESSVAGYARSPGALLAQGPALTVRFDEREKPLGETLDVKFVPFAETPALEARAEELYAIDFDASPPRILLNSSVPDFKMIMKSRARRGRDARVRNALFSSIAAQVWTSLASVSLADLRGALWDESGIDPDPQSVALVIDEIPAWEASVLRFLAPKMYPSVTGTPLEAMAADLISGGGVSQQARLSDAIQVWVRMRYGFDGMVAMRNDEGV